MRGEIDARATSADTVLQRNPEWLEKKPVDFHAMIEVPKGEKHAHFAHLPELESFARTKRTQADGRAARLQGCRRALRPTAGPPKDRVEIIQEAFRKTYKDPGSRKEYKKFTADDPTPLMPEAHEKTIREIPRDLEVSELFKKLMGADPLPPH